MPSHAHGWAPPPPLQVRYQDYMLVPPSEIKLPSAVDFFDYKRWEARFSGPCAEWLQMFTMTQSFTQFLEVRLAPRDTPELDVVFFNESIDAKQMRSAKARLLRKHATPLLTTGEMPPGGYVGHLVPPAVRTVYNASMIAARPTKSQQQVGVLLILGSGLQESHPEQVATFVDAIKQEFARNLLWSRVDVGAALLPHVVPWASHGHEWHTGYQKQGMEQMVRARRPVPAPAPLARALRCQPLRASPSYAASRARCLRLAHPAPPPGPVTSAPCACAPPTIVVACSPQPVRRAMLDLLLYSSSASYKQALHASLRESLRRLAHDGGGSLPLCVVAHGFGSALAIDFFTQLQRSAADSQPRVPAAGAVDTSAEPPPAETLTPLERGQTIAYMCTLGSPMPVLAAAAPTGGSNGGGGGGGGAALPAAASLVVPAPPVLRRWPHLRGGWANFYHRGDTLGFPLQSTHPAITQENECCRLHKSEAPIQSMYFSDLVECVSPLAQAISWVWQDTNRNTK